jgi:hypothetical protein
VLFNALIVLMVMHCLFLLLEVLLQSMGALGDLKKQLEENCKLRGVFKL